MNEENPPRHFTDEQLKIIKNNTDKIVEVTKKIVNSIVETIHYIIDNIKTILNSIVETIHYIIDNIKTILNTDVNLYKKKKKGKRYVYMFEKIKLWKILNKIRK